MTVNLTTMESVEEASEYRQPSIPFTVGEKLGAGAFGEVFKTEENGGKKRIFAVKYIKCTNNDELEDAMNEIKALVALEHINIVKIYDFGLRQHWQMEVEYSLLLEYCSGGSLNDYLGKQNSRSQKLSWVRSITSAIVYLHKKKIVHQDLKPDNILLTESGVVKVADFGLARRFARRNEGQTWNSYYLEEGVGAIFYVAPEMLDDHHTYKVDVFSLGILFHAIFEGDSKEHEGERHYGVFVLTDNGESGPIGIEIYKKKMNLRVPFRRWRRRLIEKMLKYDPHERPTAAEVEDVLSSSWRRWFQLG